MPLGPSGDYLVDGIISVIIGFIIFYLKKINKFMKEGKCMKKFMPIISMILSFFLFSSLLSLFYFRYSYSQFNKLVYFIILLVPLLFIFTLFFSELNVRNETIKK